MIGGLGKKAHSLIILCKVHNLAFLLLAAKDGKFETASRST